jgi:Lamin Tail Domain
MKRSCLSTTILLLIIVAMMPAIAAGADSYWSNQITGPDYSVPESAFNPRVSPYQYDIPGALLPYDFSDTLPTTPSSGQAYTPYLYPQAVSLLPIYPDMVPMPVVPGNLGNTIPSAALLFPYQTGSLVPVSIQVPSQIPLVFPVAVIPDTADEDSDEGSMAPAPHPAPGEEVFISDLDVHEEYVRITNNGLSPMSMTGWKIVAGSTQRSITFIDWPQGNGQTFSFTLYPLTTLTVYYGKSGPVTATEAYWPSATNVWNDAGDTAFLYAPDGRLVSSLSR